MSAEERVKLRMKIGVHEFEAEGPRELVAAQLETWMRAAGVTGLPAAPGPDPALRGLFHVDADQRLITLRARVNGRRRNADAALVLLYAFDTCFGAGDGGEIPASRLRAALTASGHRLQRVDRTLAPYLSAGFVRKGGRHKHETYALTKPGAERAAALARHLASR